MAEDTLDGRGIRLVGLPDFNTYDADFRITNFDGIFSTPPIDAQYAAYGGGPGSVASGPWNAKERPLVLQGFINAAQNELPGYARALANALPANADSVIQILGGDRDIDLQIFVRRYDKADLPISSRLDFTFPLLALDPYLYGLSPLTGGVGVLAGSFWYGTLAKPAADWVQQYTKAGADWYETFSNIQPPGPYPTSVSLTPPVGGTVSRRLQFDVYGPLGAGDWQLVQVGTGREMWVQLAIPAGQHLSVDMYAETATMNGEDVSSYLYGDMLTLEPSGSTFQLTSTTPNSVAYAAVTALPAYEI